MLLVAPSEPKSLRALGTFSAECERNGVDFLLANGNGEWIGVQRKRVDDLVASVRGDRIARELAQAESLTQAILLVEGDWRWSGETSTRTGITRAQYDGIMLSIQVEHGWQVMHSTGLLDTAVLLRRIEAWFAKPHHDSLSRRPKPRGEKWGQNGHRGTGAHVLQSFDGIGVSAASTIIDHFGRVPLTWTCTREEMAAVPGIGPKRVARMWEALP